jgi:hypothetical protein
MTFPDTSGPDVYGNAYVDYGYSGETTQGNTTMTDDLVQEHANGTTVKPEDLLGYHNHGAQDDYLNQRAGMFRTNKPSPKYDVAVSRPVPSASSPLITAPGLLAGWAFRETSGTAGAVIRLRSGLDVNQPVILAIALAANESTRDFPGLPVELPKGLYLELVSGTIEGNIFTRETRNV